MNSREQQATTGTLMVWRYDGKWERIADPIDWNDGGDYEEVIARAGFSATDHWGFSSTPDVTIYMHDSDERWRVNYELGGGSRIYEIEVFGLPNLIKLLSDLAAISTASQLSSIAEEAEDLIWNAAEDGRRERKRRLR